MSKRGRSFSGSKLIVFILFIVSLVLMSLIIYLNIFNLSLLLLIGIIILVILYLSIFLLLKSRFKIFGMIFSLLFIILFLVISFYVNKTYFFLSDLSLGYKTYNYSVMVSSDSNTLSFDDIDSFGYLDDDSIEGKKALDSISDKILVSGTGYRDTYSLVNSLINERVDAILIEDSYLDILSEDISLNKIDKFYDFSVVINTNSILDDIDVTSKSFNIYVSGVDSYDNISRVSRSDVNMFISVNPSSRKILIASIPRDYYVSLSGKSGYKDKLTHAGLYGVDTSIMTIEDLLDIDINYYVKVNFNALIDLVDEIGGISVYSDYDFVSVDNIEYKKGINHLNGEEALSFLRERKAFALGDRQRVLNQQKVIEAILKTCLSKELIVKYSNILETLDGSFVTNMPMSRITSLIKVQIIKNYKWDISMNSLSGSDSSNYTYSSPRNTSYVMVADDESVEYGSKLIKSVILNEELDGEVAFSKNNTVNDDMNVSKFEVKLVRSSVKLNKGDEYIYHGIVAFYDDTDVTSKTNVKFKVNDREFDNYFSLVWYITNSLDVGDYDVLYYVSYKEESVILKQRVVIV